MKVIYCDRCKKKISYGIEEVECGKTSLVPIFKIEYTELHWGRQSEDIDLCHECSKELYR